MAYHFTVDVKFWYDEEFSYYIPDYLKFVERVDGNYSCKELYTSKKYDSLTEMLEDYNAIEIPNAKPTFYKDDKLFNLKCRTTLNLKSVDLELKK